MHELLPPDGQDQKGLGLQAQEQATLLKRPLLELLPGQVLQGTKGVEKTAGLGQSRSGPEDVAATALKR